MCKVMNARHVGKKPAIDRVYVGRPSKWGNPFVIGRDGARDEVVAHLSPATSEAKIGISNSESFAEICRGSHSKFSSMRRPRFRRKDAKKACCSLPAVLPPLMRTHT